MSTLPTTDATIIDGKASVGNAEAGALVTGVYINGDSITVYNNHSIARPPTGTAPYKFLKSFTADDHWVFKGRDNEIQSIDLSIAESSVVVVSGKAGVGKTSLMRAGVMPRLVSTRTLFLTTYEEPLNVLRKITSLISKTKSTARVGSINNENGEHTFHDQSVANLNLNNLKTAVEELSLPQIVTRLTNESNRRVILVLDQFELFFRHTSDDWKRSAFIAELTQVVNDKSLDFRLLIVVDDNELSQILALQNNAWPNVKTSHVPITNLSEEQVREAIIEPCRAVTPQVSIDEQIVKPVFKDLVKLNSIDLPINERSKEGVYPPYLQIVCHKLYEMWKGLDDKRIDPKLYVQVSGVDGIFATYLKDALESFSTTERERAREILEKIAQPEIKEWVYPEQLGLRWINEPAGVEVLAKLVSVMLLRSRLLNGQNQYAVPNPAVIKAIRRRWGPQAEQQYLAREDLEYAYSAWLERKDNTERFPTLSKLHFLAQQANHLPTNTAKEIFLLRSACESHGPTDVWLAKLRQNKESLGVLESLNKPESVNSDDINTRLLLGMEIEGEEKKAREETGEKKAQEEPSKLAALASVAVEHPQKSIRETAAIALMTEGNGKAIGDLDEVLTDSKLDSWQQKIRWVQLRAAMTEADPGIAPLGRQNVSDRLFTFFLMVGRRAYRDRYRIGAMIIGGGLGTGISLALFGAMRAKLFGKNAFNQSSIDFFFGCIFGLVISFAIATSKHFAETYALTSRSRKYSVLLSAKNWALLFGTLAFGGAHAFILQMAHEQGLQPVPHILLTVMGLCAGFGISWSLRDQAIDETSDGALKLRPLLVASVSFFVIHLVLALVFKWNVDTIKTLVIVVPPVFYDSNLPQLSERLYAFSSTRFNTLPIYIALVGSAIIGLMFSAGIRYGLHKAIALLSQHVGSTSQQDLKHHG